MEKSQSGHIPDDIRQDMLRRLSREYWENTMQIERLGQQIRNLEHRQAVIITARKDLRKGETK